MNNWAQVDFITMLVQNKYSVVRLEERLGWSNNV